MRSPTTEPRRFFINKMRPIQEMHKNYNLMKYLIFDFDGVLGDTDSARTQVMKKMEGKTEEQIAKEKDEYFTQSLHTRSSNLSQAELDDYRVWMAQYGKLLHQ